jgi:hypothetical protein
MNSVLTHLLHTVLLNDGLQLEQGYIHQHENHLERSI